jgi:CDP-6-deoxy-D-xylo-4-hexulose-3-dehydrase
MIKLIKSSFYNEQQTSQELADFIVKSTQLSFGPQCEKFEANFSQYQDRLECVFVNSGSSANLAVVQAMLNIGYIKKGDKVGFSALTWSTNVMPLIQLGLEAVPIDVELDTLNVSSNFLNKALAKHDLKMVFITNLLGWSDDIDQIAKICNDKNIYLIEDNCESLGTVYKGKKLGNYGLASTFSFYVGHHMSTIEGGAVCTDEHKLATMIRLVRAHGWDRNLQIKEQESIRQEYRVNSTFYSRYTFYDLGYNLRPTEMAGFLGNTQLEYLGEIIKKRESNYVQISSKIYTNSQKYYSLRTDHLDTFSNFAIPIICKSVEIRDELVNKCADVIEIRPVVGGDMTEQPFYKKYMSAYVADMQGSNASLVHRQGLYFGNNPELNQKEIDEIIKVFS